ncbi:MAG TPA: CDP-glycerol glycerophosphotransferase family protein, partial [Thermoleophilaceae bacterium]|nr:CDP-glycerol glycerophosphotransferase family protein [Thermoleophilaceae bacterium]
MPPRISVVVPVYNVEPYLAECLESLASQTVRDLEVIMVDDGSKDRSGEIAQSFADRDGRFRLITQPNGGLGRARNTGIEAAEGEFLAFVDSDDFLAPNAYELLLGALDETGSDFATGNVLRLQSVGARQVGFLAEAFNKTRLGTHVSEYPPLIADRVAWNKLFRRSFWDAQGRTFPEGVLNEDIPVILPAHFAAKSVDVISDPIYYWRIRDGEQLSITQRRLEPKALHDRMAALEKVIDWLDQHGKKKWKRWYLEGVVSDDLRFYLNPLAQADDEYRQLFLDKVNAFLDRAPKGIFDKQSSIERLKWHLVRRRLMTELLEVIRFQKEELKETPPVQIDGRWYGDYPFRDDPRLNIPSSIYLLEGELALRVEIESLDSENGKLKVRGHAYIRGIGAAERDTQHVTVVALRRGRLKRVRLRVSAIKFDTTPVHRPDVTAGASQRLRNLDWSGFEATLDPRKLRTAGRLRPGVWELFVIVRSGKTHRRRARFHSNRLRPLRAAELEGMPPGVLAKAVPTGGGGVAIDARTQWTVVNGHRLVDENVLELSGEVHGPQGDKPRIEVVRRGDEKTLKSPVELDGTNFTTRIKLKQVLKAGKTGGADDAEEQEDAEEVEEAEEAVEADDRQGWDLQASGGGPARTVGIPRSEVAKVWEGKSREVWLSRTRKGDAALIDQTPRPIVREAAWTHDGELVVGGELPAGLPPQELVLVAGDYGDTYTFPLSGEDTRFEARIAPARVESLAGSLPLRAGNWGLFTRAAGAGETAPRMPVVISHALYDQLPLSTVVGRKPFALAMTNYDRAFIAVERDLDEDERGPYNQSRLRDTVYVARRTQPLKEAVIYTSFHGRQYSDSPRAIHEELVRRGAPLEHLWVVADGQCEVPPSATVVRDGSREHFDALATARYVVANDHFPDWFARRPDQVALQTWHGAPLKRLGFDVTARRNQGNRFTRWDQQIDNWQYVLSPNRFSTPILRRAYAVEGEMLETGYPRDDVLAGADREARTEELRRRLGIPEGMRTVLYAPTYRDHVYDKSGRYRLDLHLDLERLRAAVGEDTMILFRKHHYIVDPVPTDRHGFVRDVSRYPDGTELMLAADVLVTDYSSMMFDYANTGRPMLFFTYDLDAYADEIRGFYVDFTEIVPGPLLRTTDDVADA